MYVKSKHYIFGKSFCVFFLNMKKIDTNFFPLAYGSSTVCFFLESRDFSLSSPLEDENRFMSLSIVSCLFCFVVSWQGCQTSLKLSFEYGVQRPLLTIEVVNCFPQWTMQSFPQNIDKSNFFHQVYLKDDVRHVLISGAESWESITHIYFFPWAGLRFRGTALA